MLYNVDTAIALASFSLAICVFLASLRYYTRACIVKSFGLDDWFSLFSLCIWVVATAFYLDGFLSHGWGRHLTEISSFKIIKRSFRDLWSFNLFYSLSTGFIKLSFALTLRRVLKHQDRLLVVLLQATVWLVISLTVVSTCLLFTICSPPQYFWEQAFDPWFVAAFSGQDPTAMGLKRRGSCHSDGPQIAYAQTAMWLMADISLGIVLPILMLRKINMELRLKLTTGLLLGLGALASIASVVRITYTHTLAELDILYEARSLFVWTDIEYSLCLIATSCALLKPLAVKHRLAKNTSSSAALPASDSSGTEAASKASGSCWWWVSKDLETISDASQHSIDIEPEKIANNDQSKVREKTHSFDGRNGGLVSEGAHV